MITRYMSFCKPGVTSEQRIRAAGWISAWGGIEPEGGVQGVGAGVRLKGMSRDFGSACPCVIPARIAAVVAAQGKRIMHRLGMIS